MTDRMESVKLRTFDISGTRLQRSCKVFTITCDTDEIADRVADQFLAIPRTSPAGGEGDEAPAGIRMSSQAPEPCSDLTIGELVEWLDSPQFINGQLDPESRQHMSAAAELITTILAAPPAAAQSIDDVPSCGQENDYRRAAAQSNGDAAGSLEITWRSGAYYVSVPNYQGGTVYTSEHVAGLRAQLEATRKALEEITAAFEGLRPLPLVLDGMAKGLIANAHAALERPE